MVLLIKILVMSVGVVAVNGFIGFVANRLGFYSMEFLVGQLVVGFTVYGLLMYKYLISPLCKLYDALKIIDFEKDIIDFSKLDDLESSGFKEMRGIQEKFKYLLDIITERINRVNSQTYKSEHDGLTGCYNRVHLDVVKGTYEVQKSVCVIFIDVNNLKRMNDEFGHEAGDALLRSAAAKLTFWQNYGDVYRMGGDEFMIVVVNKSREYVEKLINMWYPTVGQLNRDSDGFKCVLSYGVAYGSQYCNFDAVQKQADEIMYDMKVALKKKFGEPMR